MVERSSMSHYGIGCSLIDYQLTSPTLKTIPPQGLRSKLVDLSSKEGRMKQEATLFIGW
jgi:hypothetical protein